MSTTSPLKLPPLPDPANAPPKSVFGRWIERGSRLDSPHGHGPGHAWWQVLWLTGVDYFSTLAYQAGIALVAAASLAPVATTILVLVTLFCALPVYMQVANRSFVGQGSIAMIENQLSGWQSKLAVLILVGFASTDFVVTMTLSAADAAKHAVENPILHQVIGEHAIAVTLALLAILAAVFLKGFQEAIYLAMAIAIPYIGLTVVTIGRGLVEILQRPELWQHWQAGLSTHGDWTGILVASALVFPKLALGLSGFETGVMVMPQVKGDREDGHSGVPRGRVSATHKLLTAAAVLMSVMLISSSVVTTLLIPPAAYGPHGAAEGRAIAYLAHDLFGHGFGTLYDLSTIIILWFAGASAMAGMLNLIPRYLPRFGMAPHWTIYSRPLILMLFGITVLVTLIFQADVEAQAGAYATGVLVLMLSAAAAVALALGREAKEPEHAARTGALRAKSLYFWLVTAIFAFTLIDNVIERHDGLIIASVFIVVILGLGGLSRYLRATELRVLDLAWANEATARLWPTLLNKRVNLIPVKTTDPVSLQRKAADIRQTFHVVGPLAFVNVRLVDNRSEFHAHLRVDVTPIGDDYLMTLDGAVAIANTIAYVSELLDPRTLVLGLTRQNLMTQALKYILWGEGETGLLVYTILLRYWEWTPEDDVRPTILLRSDEGGSGV